MMSEFVNSTFVLAVKTWIQAASFTSKKLGFEEDLRVEGLVFSSSRRMADCELAIAPVFNTMSMCTIIRGLLICTCRTSRGSMTSMFA